MAFKSASHVAMQLPKNFDFNELKALRRDFRLHCDTLRGELLSYSVIFKSEPIVSRWGAADQA